MCLSALFGCEKKSQANSKDEMSLYYLNDSGTALEAVSYKLESDSADEKMNEIM